MLVRLLALMLFAAPLFCAEIELRYPAIERLIADQLFTQDGRHYVRGNQTNRCQFAYLEAPRIASDGGRLRVRARFSGRSAIDLFNRCIGLGDSFNVAITAVPSPRDGTIVLRDVQVTAEKDSYYIRRVRAALAQSITRDFKIEIRDHLRRLLDPSREGAAYQQELAGFDLTEIRITPQALVLVIDFRIVVK